jgi:hypothetical protein
MNIGFDNQVAWWKVSAILVSRGMGARRTAEAAGKQGKLSDTTQGRRRRSVILMDDGWVIFSSVSPETLMLRLNKKKGEQSDD